MDWGNVDDSLDGSETTESEPVVTREEIDSMENADEVINTYRRRGVNFDSVKEAFDRAQKDYWKTSDVEVDEPVELDFHSIDEVNGTEINLMGINHGRSSYFGSLNQKNKDYIVENIKESIDTQEDHLLMFEEGLRSRLEDERLSEYSLMENNDITEIHFDGERPDRGPVLSTVGRGGKELMGLLTVGGLKFGAEMSKRYDSPTFERLKILHNSLHKPEWQGNVKEAADASYLPNQMQSDFYEMIAEDYEEDADVYLREVQETLDEWQDNRLRIDKPLKQVPNTVRGLGNRAGQGIYEIKADNIERSRQMAEKISEASEEYGNIYMVVGGSHQSQIEGALNQLEGEVSTSTPSETSI